MTLQMRHPPTPAASMPLRLNDLVRIERERRIPDLTLAERLGFSKPHNVRKLIDRNRPELTGHGAIVERPSSFLRDGENPGEAVPARNKGGRPGTMYFLNEGQALVICALSRTPIAAKVRADVIAVYMAHRHGETYASYPSPTTRERYALQFLCTHGHALIVDEPFALDRGCNEMARTILIAPLTREVFDILAGFEVAELTEGDGDCDREDGHDAEHVNEDGDGDPDREPSLGQPDGVVSQLRWGQSGQSDREHDLDLDEGDDGADAEMTAVETHGRSFSIATQFADDSEDEGDLEPSLGSRESVAAHRHDGQLGWANSAQMDLEMDVENEGEAEDQDGDAEETHGLGFFSSPVDEAKACARLPKPIELTDQHGDLYRLAPL